MGRVKEYAEAMQTFRSKLLVLMHMSSGQSVVLVQYKNETEGDIRGLFIEDRLVVYITIYHKSIGMSGKAKVIYRYILREVGKLAVYYIWLAIPFWWIVVKDFSVL